MTRLQPGLAEPHEVRGDDGEFDVEAYRFAAG